MIDNMLVMLSRQWREGERSLYATSNKSPLHFPKIKWPISLVALYLINSKRQVIVAR